MSRPVLLLIALLGAGCEERPGPPPPPPQDSGANRPPVAIVPPEERTEGRGYPDRVSAGLGRVVRGDVEVCVDHAGHAGSQCIIQISVRNRSKDKPLAFTNWTKPGHATLKDDEGRAYPLIPISAERERLLREWEQGRPDPGFGTGTGSVTRERPRVASLWFDPAALSGLYLDLDLEGAPVGFTDPIRFRISGEMMVTIAPGSP